MPLVRSRGDLCLPVTGEGPLGKIQDVPCCAGGLVGAHQVDEGRVLAGPETYPASAYSMPLIDTEVMMPSSMVKWNAQPPVLVSNQ